MAHPPCDARPDRWLIVYRFATASQLQAWLPSPARQRILEEGRDLSAMTLASNVSPTHSALGP
jgi:antibiotic biosynthesis monooxygenase (ABM) superfamily enzyme